MLPPLHFGPFMVYSKNFNVGCLLSIAAFLSSPLLMMASALLLSSQRCSLHNVALFTTLLSSQKIFSECAKIIFCFTENTKFSMFKFCFIIWRNTGKISLLIFLIKRCCFSCWLPLWIKWKENLTKKYLLGKSQFDETVKKKVFIS